MVFGHEQDGVGVDAGEKWEMDQRDWLGYKKRVGGMDANNAVVDAVVFGHDQDGFTSIKALEEQMKQLPQFIGAAGVCSSEVSSSNVMQVRIENPVHRTCVHAHMPCLHIALHIAHHIAHHIVATCCATGREDRPVEVHKT